MPCQILKVKRNKKRTRPRKISARRIIEIFDENLAKARLSSFNKQINFWTLRKLDYGKLKRSCSYVNNIIDTTHYQCNDITEINNLKDSFALTSFENANFEKSCYVNDKIKSMKKDQTWILLLGNISNNEKKISAKSHKLIQWIHLKTLWKITKT